MNKKRKSCPVSQRPVLELSDFDKTNKDTFDGTETVRGLNKFQRKWFRVNAVAIVGGGKTHLGRTFVVPYKDIKGVRYWLIDKSKKERNEYLIATYGENAIL